MLATALACDAAEDPNELELRSYTCSEDATCLPDVPRSCDHRVVRVTYAETQTAEMFESAQCRGATELVCEFRMLEDTPLCGAYYEQTEPDPCVDRVLDCGEPIDRAFIHGIAPPLRVSFEVDAQNGPCQGEFDAAAARQLCVDTVHWGQRPIVAGNGRAAVQAACEEVDRQLDYLDFDDAVSCCTTEMIAATLGGPGAECVDDSDCAGELVCVDVEWDNVRRCAWAGPPECSFPPDDSDPV